MRSTIKITGGYLLFFVATVGTAYGDPDGVVSREEANSPEIITSLRELRSMTPDEAAEAIPVNITGVITYIEVGRDLCFIQNEEGAAYVNFNKDEGRIAGQRHLKLSPGDRVRIRGVSNPGGFAPSIWPPEGKNTRFKRLGKESLPEPMRLFPNVVIDPPLDAFFVEVTGVVSNIQDKDGRTVVTMNDGYSDYDLLIHGPPDQDALPEGLLNSRITAQAVYGSITRNRQLVNVRFFLFSPDWITIVEKGADAVFEKEPSNLEELSGYQALISERVHVQGIVTASLPPDLCYIRLEDGPLEIHTNQPELPEPGTRVSVAGYRGLKNGIPFLHTTAIKNLSKATPPEPLQISITAPPLSMQHGELVNIEGTLLETLNADGTTLLSLEEGASRFTAELPGGFDEGSPQPPDSASLSLTAILEKLDSGNNSQSFRIRLRSPEDITVLSVPPFWTGSRITSAIAVLLTLCGGFVLWSFWLRAKVHQQASLLAKKSEAEKVQDERNRISRELHDTLEQDLVALAMQLNLAADHFARKPEASRDSLESARRILTHTRMESRHSIQDLREEDFGQIDLAEALKRLVTRFQMDTNILVEYQPPPPVNLPPETRRNTLLIVRESIHNSIQHSRAENIRLRGEIVGNDCLLIIEDDGTGFETQVRPAGHFGIQGMAERAQLMKADFRIESSPERGTCVYLQLKNVYS